MQCIKNKKNWKIWARYWLFFVLTKIPNKVCQSLKIWITDSVTADQEKYGNYPLCNLAVGIWWQLPLFTIYSSHKAK